MTRRSSGSGESGNGQRIGWFTDATNRPPGRSTRATSASTAPTSATNGSPPNAEQARSTQPSASGSAPASACSSGTPMPVARFSSAARASIPAGEVQRDDVGARAAAASASTGAEPQPISSTRRPATSPSRCASASRSPSGHHRKSASPRSAPCSAR